MPSPHASGPSHADRWLLVTDIDDTLIGDDCALSELLDAVRAAEIPIVLNSSRPTTSVRRTLADAWPEGAPPPDAVITALGTEIDYAARGHDDDWERSFASWPRDDVARVVTGLGFAPHADEFQTPYKASFVVPAADLGRVEAALDEAGIPRQIIHSGDTDFDVIPPQAGKAAAMLHVAGCLDIRPDRIIVAGDSGNDLVMFQQAPRGIVVGNARPELRDVVDPARAYFATAQYAAGMLEALRHWALIPDRSDR